MLIKCHYIKFSVAVATPIFQNITRTQSSSCRNLNLENINRYIETMYDVRKNEVRNEANTLEKQLGQGSKLPFNKVTRADIFEPQAVNYSYITYVRQVLALLCLRHLFKHPHIPEDVKNRAGTLKRFIQFGSIGVYGPQDGLAIVRKHVADYISSRDEVDTNMDNIFLCEGICDGFRTFIKMLNCKIDGKIPGIILPIPHFPIYSALIQSYGMEIIHYHLDEPDRWQVVVSRIRSAISKARRICNPRALVIINPDLITGTLLAVKTLIEIIKLVHEERLVLIVEETFHTNIYEGKFDSIRRAQKRLDIKYRNVEIVSLMTCAGGWFGECGIRSGYIELANFGPDITDVYFNTLTLTRKPNIPGQLVLDVFVNPPEESDASYEQFMKEKNDIQSSLKQKNEMVKQEFQSFKGITCKPVQGGIATFPRIQLPRKVRKQAAEEKKSPDVYFALKLLKATGISVVPGSYLGMPNGKYHICFTILPDINEFRTMLKRIKSFYEKFYKEHK